MGNTFGPTVLASYGRTVRASATDDTEYKIGGITVDWSTVAPAAGVPTVFPDGATVPVGQKGLRYGSALAKITASGLYGPADTSAADGRQLRTAGEFFILDVTVLETAPLPIALGVFPSNHPPVIDGGTVWKDRLNVGGANQPTLAQVLAVLPRLKIVEG